MTGIERLRELARRSDTLAVPLVHGTYCAGYVAATEDMREKLSAIADQIEREQNEMVADSPYDAILPEDREAIAWVREHGGLEAVRSEWSSRVPYDKHERRRQRLLGHIAECEEALGRRNQRIEELGKHIQSLTTENADMRKRLMPDGMEWLVEAWPRFEDSEPVRVGDEVSVTVHDEDGDFDRTLAIRSIKYEESGVLLEGTKNEMVVISHGERVKRPAPKVLDADDVPIKVGDVVWSLTDGRKHEVTGIDPIVKEIRIKDESMELGVWVAACGLTHRAPVLADDGKPLREGETVWDVESGTEYEVVGIHTDEDSPVRVMRTDGSHLAKATRPSTLTHQRPDSWERLEEDANASTCTYFGATTKDCEICGHVSWECSYDKDSDLVRRAKKLAGRDAS